MEKLIIAGREFNSRLFLGTGKFNSNELMEQSILASGTEMVTVAMKRIDMENSEDDMLKHIVHPHIQLLPNTSGVRNAEEAVFAGQMAREAFGTNWLKLEIHPDPRYLLPDSALQSDDRGAYVYIVDAQDKVQRRDVKLGQVSDAGVAITSGLNGTERVVRSAGGFLAPGQKIKPVLQKA